MKGKLPHSSQFFTLLSAARAVRAKDVVSLAIVAAIVTVLEVVGRMHASELVDLASSCVVALAIGASVSWHYRWRLTWTAWLVQLYRRMLERLSIWKFDWGLDLRRTPPLARGCPPLMWMIPTALAALTLAAIAWQGLTGMALRPWVTQVSYVAYIIGLTAMWLSLALSVLTMAIAPSWLLLDLLISYTGWDRPRAQRVTWLARATYLAMVLVLSVLLPTWVASLVWIASIVLAAVVPWLPPTWHPDCIWRSSPRDPVRSLSLGTMFSLQLVILALIPAAPIVLALGGEAIGLNAAALDAPLSLAMGRVAIWLASCGLLLLFGLLGGHIFISRWHDPSRPAPPVLHVRGAVDAATKTRWLRQFAERGWRLRFAPQRATRTDVCVQLTDAAPSSGDRSAVACQASDMDDAEFLFRLARRDQIQRRRLLVHGLETIFRRAARKKGRAGCGFWVAPQYWFVDGLTRDEITDDETALLEVIPPLYHRAIPRPARRHFFEIARAVEIDLLFVEDGVGLRGLRAVLRVMFERYDIDGGRDGLKEIHFAGLPKMRVIIHDYTLDQPWTHTNYPEPDYRHLGRVRILHVFKDRGAEDELSETPEDPDWIFSPAGML